MVTTAPTFVAARVMHKRLLPRVHGFTYGVFYLCFPLGQIDKIRNTLLSVDNWNLLSFYRRDHGARDGSDLEIWIRKILLDNNVQNCDGEIVLLTMPRILGYVFNPVSFWFCYDSAKQLRVVLSEVNNTFGESHSYLSYHDDFAPIKGDDWFDARKVFHVSPFLDIIGHYKFRFMDADDRMNIQINLFEDEQMRLATSVTGRKLDITLGQTLRLVTLYPLMTLKTIFLIHFEALRLWLKGMKYYSKPPPPAHEVTR